MRILLTGGLGFVGSNLLELLEKDEAVTKIIIVDNLCYTANLPVIEKLGNKSSFIKGDICDTNLMRGLVRQSDVVINLAAQAFVDNSISNARPFVDTNVLGVLSLLEAIKQDGFRCRLIHASTDEVWGDILEGSFTEDSPYLPRNPYAATKAAGDHLVRSFGNTFNLNYNIVHFTNLYGPWMYPERLIPKTIVRFMANERMGLHGDGNQIRTWLHVSDAVQGVMKILHSSFHGESFALGMEAEHTNLEVVSIVAKIMSKKLETAVEYIPDRLGQDFRYSVCSTKSMNMLNWKPTISLEQGLNKLVKWYSHQHDE